MLKVVCRISIPLLLFLASLAQGGELRLDNGALLPGELANVGASTLVWRADKIGEVTVAKSDVLSLQTSRRTAVESAPGAPAQSGCTVGVENSRWSIHCDAEPPTPVAFAELRTLPPATSSTGVLAASLDIDRGSNASEEATVDLDARWLRPGYRHLVDVSIDYEQSDGDTTEDNADASYQFDILRDRGWYWFSRARYFRDDFQALQEAYTGSGGIGRELTPARDLTLTLQAGPAITYYYYNGQDGEMEPAAGTKWTALWHTPWFGIDASHTGEFNQLFSSADAYLFQSKTGLSFPLYRGLIAQLRLDYDRSGVNIGDNARYNQEWVLALGYKW